MTTASQSSVSCVRSVNGSEALIAEALIAMSDIPIPRNDQAEGEKALRFHCQDDGAGSRCRGPWKKSDVRPARLTSNSAFLPSCSRMIGHFSLLSRRQIG